MVLDEQKYWEQFIAFVVLVFTIYPIARDYLQPVSPLIDNKAFTLIVVKYAMIASIIIFVVGYLFYRYVIVSKQPQTTANTPLQTQENMPSRDHIKAQLDLLKIVITPLITAMSLIALYTIQTSGYNNNEVWIPIIVIGGFVIFLGIKYYKPLMNELR